MQQARGPAHHLATLFDAASRGRPLLIVLQFSSTQPPIPLPCSKCERKGAICPPPTPPTKYRNYAHLGMVLMFGVCPLKPRLDRHTTCLTRGMGTGLGQVPPTWPIPIPVYLYGFPNPYPHIHVGFR